MNELKNADSDAPNILFLFIDDLGWRDLGCYGSNFYETPHLDQLAADGLRFTDAYAACPVCSPTRAAVLSGKYPARVGVTQFIGGHGIGRLCDVPYMWCLPASEHSLARALGDGGYQTWHIGKWHLGERRCTPTGHGFDVNIGGCGWGHPTQGYFAPFGPMPGLEDTPEGTYLTDELTDRAIALMKNRNEKKPFFMNFWHYAVHTPIQAPADLIKKYEEKAQRLGINQNEALEEGEYFPCHHKKSERIQRRKFQSDPAYAAMMENLDMNIGKLLQALDDEGLRENTLVVFSADNGGLATAEGSPTCNAPLNEGKGWMYEGGTRICQIMRWPKKIAPNQTSDCPVTSTDFYPTFLEAAGLPEIPLQHQDGVSLMPLLNGEKMIERDAIFWHYPHYSNQGDTPACSIRQGDWKLIEHFEDGRLELFNVRDDISETMNLADRDDKRTIELHTKLVNWRRGIEALIPKPNPNWQPYQSEPDVTENCEAPHV